MCDRQITEWPSSVTPDSEASDRHNHQPMNIYVDKKRETEVENSDASKPEEPRRRTSRRSLKYSAREKCVLVRCIRALKSRRSGTNSSPPPRQKTKPTCRSTTGMINRLPKWAHTVASQALGDTIPQNKEKLKVFHDIVEILSRINRLPDWAQMIIQRSPSPYREIGALTEILERNVKMKMEDPMVIREI